MVLCSPLAVQCSPTSWFRIHPYIILAPKRREASGPSQLERGRTYPSLLTVGTVQPSSSRTVDWTVDGRIAFASPASFSQLDLQGYLDLQGSAKELRDGSNSSLDVGPFFPSRGSSCLRVLQKGDNIYGCVLKYREETLHLNGFGLSSFFPQEKNTFRSPLRGSAGPSLSVVHPGYIGS